METLRRLRTEKGLSQARLAARAEVDPSTVNQIERGAREASPATLRKLAAALDVGIADLLEDASPKAGGRSSPEPSRFNDADLEHEWALRYLGAWREFVWKLREEWKEEPPKTSRDIAPLLNAMTALVDQGVFELSNASSGDEHIELTLVMEGLKWLNAIADKVEADEEAEKRRAVLRVVEDQIGA